VAVAEGGRAQGFQPIDLADRLAVAYLALPVLIFFLGWFSPGVGAVLAVLLVLGLFPAFDGRGARLHLGASWGVVLVSLATAVVWTALGGAGHFVYANTDWLTRDAVLRDLVVSGWPPSYGTVGGVEVILRTPVAYYLPAALLGKMFDLERADFLLFLWTALGIALFLVIALSYARTARQVVIAIAVIVFFSGMDVFGTDQYFLHRPSLTQHLEWWAQMFQYSANTTQLFWVPNHALPGWLVAALIFKHWHNPEFLKTAPIAIAVTALWSPLVTIGLAPFAILIVVHHLQQRTWRAGLLPWSWLGVVTTFAVIGYYLVLDTAGIRSGSTVSVVKSFDGFAMLYLKFVLLEFGFIALAIWLMRRNVLIAVSVLILLALPFYMFGPGNDLVMRGSIPALMILCLAAIDVLVRVKWNDQLKLVIPLLVCLTFGSITAIHEITRALLVSRWVPQLHRNLIEVSRGTPAHYVARLSPLLALVMRTPHAVPGLSITPHRNPRAQEERK
jgi:hypothetical protein